MSKGDTQGGRDVITELNKTGSKEAHTTWLARMRAPAQHMGSPCRRCACMFAEQQAAPRGRARARACTSWQRPATDSSAGARCRPPGAAAAALPRRVAASKNAATFSASSVAEEMRTRRSGRRRSTFFSSPSSVSVARLRSCASSTMTTLRGRTRFGVRHHLSDFGECWSYSLLPERQARRR